MFRVLFFLIINFLIANPGFSQGKITFNEPANVSSIFSAYILKNRTESTVRGWRIQLISTDDRREMENAKLKFSNLYPGIPSAWKHLSPYYHLRVGAYRTKIEMMSFLSTLKKEFPAAIPVQDDIQKYDLIRY